MRLMFDSITAADIPFGLITGNRMVAGYMDGIYAWSAADWARFPNARKVELVALASTVQHGHCGDYERGNSSIEEWVQWVKVRRSYGWTPALYFSASALPIVEAAFRAAGMPPPLYFEAQWNGVADPIPGAIAHQFASPGTGSGGHYDRSIVADYWPDVDPKPQPTPPQPAPIPVPAPAPTPTPPAPPVPEPPTQPLPIPTPEPAPVVHSSWLSRFFAFIRRVLHL